MLCAPRRRGTFARGLHIVAMVLALVSQLGLAVATLEVHRERSWASHVDAGGTSQHYAHDESTCVSCQVHSMQRDASRPESPAVPELLRQQDTGAAVVTRPPAERLTSVASPRAPPA